ISVIRAVDPHRTLRRKAVRAEPRYGDAGARRGQDPAEVVAARHELRVALEIAILDHEAVALRHETAAVGVDVDHLRHRRHPERPGDVTAGDPGEIRALAVDAE